MYMGWVNGSGVVTTTKKVVTYSIRLVRCMAEWSPKIRLSALLLGSIQHMLPTEDQWKLETEVSIGNEGNAQSLYFLEPHLTCMRWVGTVTKATACALRSRPLRECRNRGREGVDSAMPPSSSHSGEPSDWRAILRTLPWVGGPEGKALHKDYLATVIHTSSTYQSFVEQYCTSEN